jgi:hypothetical protein
MNAPFSHQRYRAQPAQRSLIWDAKATETDDNKATILANIQNGHFVRLSANDESESGHVHGKLRITWDYVRTGKAFSRSALQSGLEERDAARAGPLPVD